MSSLERKRDEFRKYLENAGAIDNLTKALIKLYEEQNKPSDAIKYIRKFMCESCPDDEMFEKIQCDLEKANKKICQLERDLMRVKGSIRRSASEVNLTLAKGFEELNSDSKAKSILKQFLTKEIIELLKDKKTNMKGTLLDCIQSGLEMFDSPIGVFACDQEAYSNFALLFDSVIENIHGFKKDAKHPAVDWGEVCKIPDLNNAIMSVQIQARRNIDCMPFLSNYSFDQCEKIMEKVQKCTKYLSGDLKGKFYALEELDKDFKNLLLDEGLLFSEHNQFMKASKADRFWPLGRGIFLNEAKTFIIWCNQEDHLSFLSIEKGANLKQAYDLLISGVTEISKNFVFARHERLGFLTFSPENLGNTLTVSVTLKLFKLPTLIEKMTEISEKFGLQITKLNDESRDIYEVQNKKRLGITEYQTIDEFSEGINALVDAENSL